MPSHWALAVTARQPPPQQRHAGRTESRRRARLKRDTGLNLLPTLTRLAKSRHLSGGKLNL
jgi:hypothetical protein